MRIAILDHQTKALHLARSLLKAGFELARDATVLDYEVLLVDTDHPGAPPAPHKHNLIRAAARLGIPVVIYPHGGMSVLDYDGFAPWATLPVSLHLVHGEGDVEVYRRFGYPRRVEAVGWSYCEVNGEVPGATDLPRPEKEHPPAHLVFAPIHPWKDGHGILPFHKALNQVAYQQFADHPAGRKTVRMFGADEPNGIVHRHDGIDYQQSDLTLGLDLIDEADAVVSYGTFACTALARGKSVAMIYPFPPHFSDDGQTHAAHFDDYKDYVRYPASVGDAPLEELLGRDTSEWKQRFVGGPLDMDKLAGLLHGLRPNRAVRRRLAKAR